LQEASAAIKLYESPFAAVPHTYASVAASAGGIRVSNRTQMKSAPQKFNESVIKRKDFPQLPDKQVTTPRPISAPITGVWEYKMNTIKACACSEFIVFPAGSFNMITLPFERVAWYELNIFFFISNNV
jgi:hypothetical protein